MTTVYRVSSSSEYKELDAYLTLNAPVSWDIHTTLERSLNRKAEEKAHAAFYVAYDKSDEIEGVLAHEVSGGMHIFAPNANAIPLLADMWAKHPPKKAQGLTDIFGPNEQVLTLVSSLNIGSQSNYRKVVYTPFFSARLDEVTKPTLPDQNDLTICRATKMDSVLCTQWMTEFFVEALGASLEFGTRVVAIDSVSDHIKNKSLFILKKKDQPIGMCGIDGFLPYNQFVHSVRIVPEKRHRGYAQAMVSGALDIRLQELLAAKKTIGKPLYASLVTDNPKSMRTYEQIGLKETGAFRRNVLYRSAMNSIISDYLEQRHPAP